SATDPIVRYIWNFGDRAVPERQSGTGPFGILYESFGDKIAALTVESSRGCLVTKIKEFFVQPCCKDTSTLDVNAVVTDLRCFEIPEGQILAQGLRGAPDYKFSIDGRNFRTNPLFSNLKAGNYQIIVEDLKGCKDTISTSVNQPPQIEVDAGEDQTIEFGNTTFLSATFVSANGSHLLWTPEDDFDVNGISKPEVYPKTTTTYILTLTDDNGCTMDDNVTIRVNKEYKVTVPNIFTPDGSSNNDFFNIWTNRSVKYIELLEVYDRWGNLVYQGIDSRSPESGNLVVNDVTQGWDGLFQNKKVNPGVFAWRAKVRFIDDEVKNFAGDLTLLR
ncbi:MAG: gliding motility-associated C-terminal domain-containing protein, partial [Saprospiraceae bacterium]